MSDDQNGIYRHTFFKKGRKVQNSALSWDGLRLVKKNDSDLYTKLAAKYILDINY